MKVEQVLTALGYDPLFIYILTIISILLIITEKYRYFGWGLLVILSIPWNAAFSILEFHQEIKSYIPISYIVNSGLFGATAVVIFILLRDFLSTFFSKKKNE